MKEQLYCVVATVNGQRRAISGLCSREHAEMYCKLENEVPAYRRINKYPKVAKYPYKTKQYE